MEKYKHVSLKSFINEIGESKTKNILSVFSCPKNKDVEYFLRNRAIEFAKQDWAQTHLVFLELDETSTPLLVGYFTLTTKCFNVPKCTLSKTLQKKIHSFGPSKADCGIYEIPAPLIAQLGKNYSIDENLRIKGDDLINIAFIELEKMQSIVGGRIIYIECEDKDKLLTFYEKHGFQRFNKRLADNDEKSTIESKYLIQLLRYKKFKAM